MIRSRVELQEDAQNLTEHQVGNSTYAKLTSFSPYYNQLDEIYSELTDRVEKKTTAAKQEADRLWEEYLRSFPDVCPFKYRHGGKTVYEPCGHNLGNSPLTFRGKHLFQHYHRTTPFMCTWKECNEVLMNRQDLAKHVDIQHGIYLAKSSA